MAKIQVFAFVAASPLIGSVDTGVSRPRMKWGGQVYDNWDGNERYLHYTEQPKSTDKDNAILAGGDVKCDACQTICRDALNSLSGQGKLGEPNVEDLLLDFFEAEMPEAEKELQRKKNQTDLERWVALRRTGCNKLFKDNYLAQGWVIEKCHKLAKDQNHNTPTEHQAPWACVRQSRRLPTAKDMDTYKVQNEAMYYACEATIGRNREDIAAAIAEKLKTGTPQDKIKLDEVCKSAGKCLKRKASETPEARVKVIMDRLYSQDKDVDELLAKTKRKIERQRAKDAKMNSEEDKEEPAERVDTVEL